MFYLVNKKNVVHSKVVEKATAEALRRRGVELLDIAKIVHEMQLPYNADLTLDRCLDSVKMVLKKENYNMQS